jgi:hypothetical protein
MSNGTMSRHEEFYRVFHAAMLSFLTANGPEIAALRQRFARYPDSWTRAFACGYYRAAHLHNAVAASARDYYELKAPELAQLVAPGADTGPDCHAFVRAVMEGFDATLAYDATDEPLDLAQIEHMAEGLAALLIIHPGFVGECARERTMESLSADVTSDLLGDWPD